MQTKEIKASQLEPGNMIRVGNPRHCIKRNTVEEVVQQDSEVIVTWRVGGDEVLHQDEMLTLITNEKAA